MRFNKGDQIDSYKIQLLLKDSGQAETYRVRNADGMLCVLKYHPSEMERQFGTLSDLYVSSGPEYVVYRHISGETLAARLARQIKCDGYEVKLFTVCILSQLARIHKSGYTHAGLAEDNVMIDLTGSEPKAWIIGLGSLAKSDDVSPSVDVKAVGAMIYHMIFGVTVGNSARIRVGMPSDNDSLLQDVMYKALASEFADAGDMLDALLGHREIGQVRRSLGPGFEAVAGLDDLKKRLQEDVIDILADKEGARLYGLEIPNGMLLYGPPGCGKTFIAEKFAEQAGYNYRYVKSSDLASTYLHGSQEKIAALFDQARKDAPSIICFDEFDALVPDRSSWTGEHQAGEINEFLSQMNNCGHDGVFVIATTNRPDKIDSAVLRTGRIDYMIYVPIPDMNTREAMFVLALKTRPTDPDIDYEALARCTEGYLTSDITAIVHEAARIAFRLKTDISEAMIYEVLKNRKPSMSKDSIKEYEAFRQRFEGQRQERKKIGF